MSKISAQFPSCEVRFENIIDRQIILYTAMNFAIGIHMYNVVVNSDSKILTHLVNRALTIIQSATRKF